MRSINYSPAPIEFLPDLSECGILQDYEFCFSEYPGAYHCHQLLKHFTADYSMPTDDFYLENGMIHSNWIIFVTMRPKDRDRLEYILNRLSRNFLIIDYS